MCGQARAIIKNGWLTDIEIESIRRKTAQEEDTLLNDVEGSADGRVESKGDESVQEEEEAVGAVEDIGLRIDTEVSPEERGIVD